MANAYKLDNLIFVIDCNKFQANMATEDLIPLEPLIDKFKAFGACVVRIDGHNFQDLENAFTRTLTKKGKLNVIIADTIRGKGLPSIEARADRWFCNFSEQEVQQLLEELHGEHEAMIESEVMVVR